MNNDFRATVIKLIKEEDSDDIYEIVINKGSEHGVKKGNKFIIYEKDSEELFDPETNNSLGYMEIVKGEGIAKHVQDKITIIRSNEYCIKKSAEKVVEENKPMGNIDKLFAFYSYGCKQTVSTKYIEPIKELKPFNNIKKNDLVKPL